MNLPNRNRNQKFLHHAKPAFDTAKPGFLEPLKEWCAGQKATRQITVILILYRFLLPARQDLLSFKYRYTQIDQTDIRQDHAADEAQHNQNIDHNYTCDLSK